MLPLYDDDEGLTLEMGVGSELQHIGDDGRGRRRKELKLPALEGQVI